MLCEFELGRMVKDLPTVDARLSEAKFIRRRDPWELVVTFPKATSSGEYTHEDGDEDRRVHVGMHCSTFVVELAGESDIEVEEAQAEAFAYLVQLAGDVADSIWVEQATQGFAGSAPKIVRHELQVDGSNQHFKLAQRHAAGSVFLNLPIPQYEDVRRAAEDAVRPSEARVLLAQATRWGLAEHFASKAAALLLAATACEIAIKSVVSRDPYGNLGNLANVLDPVDKQAPLSPGTLLEYVIPVSLGRSVTDDEPGLIKKYKELTRLRDSVVHTGKRLDQKSLWPHLNTTRTLLDWIERRLSEVPVGSTAN